MILCDVLEPDELRLDYDALKHFPSYFSAASSCPPDAGSTSRQIYVSLQSRSSLCLHVSIHEMCVFPALYVCSVIF